MLKIAAKKRTRISRARSSPIVEADTSDEPELELESESESELELKKEKIVKEETPKRGTSRKSTVLLESIKSASTPLSPLKRPSNIHSRIPSPIRKNLNSRLSESIDLSKVQSASMNAFQNKSLPKLSSIIDDLRSTKQDQIFDKYRSSMDLQLHAAKELISSLTIKNNQLEQELIDTKVLLAEETKPETPSKQANQYNEQDFIENELILDMMEQVVGLRIHKVEDTEDALFFNCSQSGKNGVLDYRLTILKEDSSEIIYSPLQSKESTEELTSYLPEYFFDDLTFPLDTLQQFYHKIYRGLNK